MMGLSGRIGWILLGVVIGIAASSSIGIVVAQQPAQSVRLAFSPQSNNLGGDVRVGFLKDTKTGSCWLMFETVGTIAPAPATSCQ